MKRKLKKVKQRKRVVEPPPTVGEVDPKWYKLKRKLDGIREIITAYDAAEDMPAIDALRDIESNL